MGNRSILIGHIEMTPTLLFLLNDFMAYPNGTASTANQLNRSSSPARHLRLAVARAVNYPVA